MPQENQTIPGTGTEDVTPKDPSNEPGRPVQDASPSNEIDPFRPQYLPDPPEGDDLSRIINPATGLTQADVNRRYEEEVSKLYGGASPSPRAVQAAIDFDPSDPSIQSAELYSFSDSEYEKDGYF